MKPSALAFVSLLAALPLHAATIVAEPFPPARFTSLYIEWDDKGKSTTIQLSGEAVVYTVTTAGKAETTTVHPSGDAWFKFIQDLNSANVYQWAPKYYYPGQGASWVIDIVLPDRTFNSEGTNDYPKNGAVTEPAADPKGEPSIPFLFFWQAVLELVGKVPPSPPAK